MLSPEVQTRLDRARTHQENYRPNESVCEKLRQKSIVMCVGPVAVGKSFVMNRVLVLDEDFRRTPVFTTRDARPDDEPGMFRVMPHDDASVTKILDQIDAGELVNYAVHPTSGRIYGTTAADYPGTFNLLAMLSGGVAQLQKLPFASVHTIGLVTDATAWKTWLDVRYPQPTDERQKRLKEAVTSLEWLLATSDSVRWVSNSVDRPHLAPESVVRIVKYNQQSSDVAAESARQMLKTAKELL